MSPLPPLAAIRAFEAATRHESFTKAAAELGMTQAAVSYQVKLLEDRLGLVLFRRQPRRVELSDAGRRLAPATTEAFQRLEAAFADVREATEGVLSITAVGTFGTNWLVPRLGAFQVGHPEIAVRLDSSSHLVDFQREDFDVGIRHGGGEWPGLKAHKLMTVEYTAMCSPQLLSRLGQLARVGELPRLPFLESDWDAWQRWFQKAGVAVPVKLTGPDLRFETQSMIASAAMAGHGVALLTPVFFAADLAAGRLVRPFNVVLREGSYWLVYPEGRQNAPKIRTFRDWLLEEVRRDRECAKAG
ncbi:MAG TPA: transcriptional regulator GcvA [Alphaproteobacteria bacterium]|nr:transcriptional regulator GcvA [Alphaproteobacteria bacterium]